MKKIDLYISREAPNVHTEAAWLKPVDGGYVLSVLDGGWKPVKMADNVDVEAVKTELKTYIDSQIEALG